MEVQVRFSSVGKLVHHLGALYACWKKRQINNNHGSHQPAAFQPSTYSHKQPHHLKSFVDTDHHLRVLNTPKGCYSTWKNSFFLQTADSLLRCNSFEAISSNLRRCLDLLPSPRVRFTALCCLKSTLTYSHWDILDGWNFCHGKILHPNGRKDQRRSTTNNKNQKKWSPPTEGWIWRSLIFRSPPIEPLDMIANIFDHRCVETYSYLNLN